MRPIAVFGDRKTDFVFQRIFLNWRSEDHQTALLGFLNDILQLDETHRIASVTLLPPEQRPRVNELKNSIVDVKCVDHDGDTPVGAGRTGVDAERSELPGDARPGGGARANAPASRGPGLSLFRWPLHGACCKDAQRALPRRGAK